MLPLTSEERHAVEAMVARLGDEEWYEIRHEYLSSTLLGGYWIWKPSQKQGYHLSQTTDFRQYTQSNFLPTSSPIIGLYQRCRRPADVPPGP